MLMALTLISSTAQLGKPEFYSKSQVLYAQYYASVYNNVDQRLQAYLPWPNFATGGMGWYRHGLREVASNARLIKALGDDRVPAILLAAAIANQGGSAQRPFGIDAIERLQYWLGSNFDWPLPQWEWAAARWHQYVEEPSIGIAQLLPDEAQRLRGFGRPNLFDDRTSIRLMYAKLAAVSRAAESLGLNQTQRFILLAIGNNDGLGTIQRLVAYDRDLERYLADHPQSRTQIAKIMTFVDYLAKHGDWTLPDGINRDYIWSLASRPVVAP
ncbi:MAG: hypothetical protein DCC57_15940 [Chloroflexi bacterium]|nr:MAG: hypothetical protein DCC57_15940 [Chloroflexota bacterium]